MSWLKRLFGKPIHAMKTVIDTGPGPDRFYATSFCGVHNGTLSDNEFAPYYGDGTPVIELVTCKKCLKIIKKQEGK
jgi:hypothetical protein